MNIQIFPTICFGIPIVSCLWSMVRDSAYIEARQEILEEQRITMPVKKKKIDIWRTASGQEISIDKMEDSHLINAIKMVARNCNKPMYLGEMKDDASFKKLLKEAKKRKFKIIPLTTPLPKDGRLEYVDVLTPIPRSKLAAGMRPIDWESRPME